MKQIGTKVILNTVTKDGDFVGEIVDIDKFGRCVVKLDTQTQPVSSVLWFDERPEAVDSSLWQICFPLEEES